MRKVPAASPNREATSSTTLFMSESSTKASEDKLLPLLKVSLPTPVGSLAGRYCLHLWRASKHQRFGIDFTVVERRGDVPGCIEVAGECKHLGLVETDKLLKVNGVKPKSSADCAKALGQETSVVLLLQQRGSEAEFEEGRRCCQCCQCCRTEGMGGPPETLRVMLSLARLAITDLRAGKFVVTLSRASLQQPFGVPFSTMMQGGSTAVVIQQDMPHIGLCEGDLVLSINGEPTATGQGMQRCKRILKSSMDLTLRLKRHPARLAELRPLLDAMQGDVSVKEVLQRARPGCGAPCGALSLTAC